MTTWMEFVTQEQLGFDAGDMICVQVRMQTQQSLHLMDALPIRWFRLWIFFFLWTSHIV